MQIILLSPDHYRQNETDMVNELFKLGLERFHIRKPGYSLSDYSKYFAAIDAAFHSRIVLHGGGFELYGKLETGGIHLSSSDRDNEDVLRKIVNIPKSMISTSTHSWAEIVNKAGDYRYVFISPVFDSISKNNYKAAVDFRGLPAVRKHFLENDKACPAIFALGGVDTPHLQILQQHNFDGACIYGSIWKASDPVSIMNGMLQFTKGK